MLATADDALWWAFATITTVGYGDHYPVTGEGRIVAGILMLGGLALSGTIAAFLAASFIGAEEEVTDNELTALRVALQEHGQKHTVAASDVSEFGTRYEIDGPLISPDGRNPMIRTVWQIDIDDIAPRLITAYPLWRASR